MGTISDKLMRIINTKEDIRQALISKGYDVPTSIPFKEYAKMISDLPCRVDSFPDIEGVVARYSALGLTNEQMATNPVWVDKTGNGHDLQMKNFFWGGMSGVGGYVQDFNYFKNNATVDKIRIDEQNSNSIKVTILTTGIGNAIYIPKNIYQFNKSYFIKISSEGYDEGDMALSFYAPSTSTATTVTVSLNPNGVTEIPAIKEDDFLAVYINVSGKVGSFTVEQLPLYPGALVFDGVDDWAGCDNLPLLPKEKGYSIIALRNWITRYDATKYKRPLISNLDTNDEGAFLIEYRKDENVNDVTGSYNSFTDVYIDDNNPITWQTSSSYNGQIIKKGTSKSTNKLCICKTYFDQLSNYANAAIWEIVILDHDATEEELAKIKDYFVKTYPWLFPDQAWTTVGKTNEDEDRATIANITGNGNDLILSNFGFSKNSGYGLYQQNYAIWIKVSNRATFTVTSSKIHVTSVTAEEHADFIYTTGQQLKQKIRITGLPEGVSFVIGRSGVNLKIISQDGIYDVDILDDSSANPIIGYRINRILDSCDITIEQIPEYEGYLITDGVDDKVQSYSFTMNEDWTIVGDWELLSNVQINCGIVKAQNVYLYNTANGLLISINNPRSLQSFGTKSLHAICSDGRLYDRNWVEYEYTVDQNFAIVESSLNIGFNLNNYTQIAFKNLGIYNNQILYKDDCIKAYNYLQTLKAK
jgi:hypothetical protein